MGRGYENPLLCIYRVSANIQCGDQYWDSKTKNTSRDLSMGSTFIKLWVNKLVSQMPIKMQDEAAQSDDPGRRKV